jgi:hypothetical protein
MTNVIQGNAHKSNFTEEQITKLLSVNLIENICEITSMIDGKKVRVFRWKE